MTHTVGLMGANGLVGTPTANLLAQSAQEGRIHLVILHRSANIPKLPTSNNIELRVIDLDGPASDIEKAIKGIHVFISAVGFGALPSEPNLVEALAKSKDLVTYVPSTYSTTWTKQDRADGLLGDVIKFISTGWDKAIEMNVPTTIIYTGAYDIYWFEYGFIGSPLKPNELWANKNQLRNKFPITAMGHLAQVLNNLALRDPKSIRNTQHSVVSYWPTGNELVDLYSKINAKQATIKDFTSKNRDDIRADSAGFGAAKVGYWDKWEKDQFEYEINGRQMHGKYDVPLEQVARLFI